MRSIETMLNRFCRKHPRFGIPNLMTIVAVGTALVYLLDQFGQGISLSAILALFPTLVLRGEVWRLVTFVFVPMSGGILLLLELYFYWFIGSALEREWGSAKFTLFYLSGVVLNILFGFLSLLTGDPTTLVTMRYVNLSLFFAFATLYPNLQVLLFFIIPIKVKWLAWVDAALFAWSVISSLLSLDVVGAIENSCNVFLCTTAYLLGLDADGNFSQNAALEKLQQYASLFDLDQKTGVQITESSPHVSDAMGLPSAIGQGTHQYTTAQLARYVSTIYNSGTSYELNLLDKVTDSEGNTVEEFSPKVSKQMNVEDWIWEDVHEGMRRMIQSSGTLQSLPLELYGKSGTAQESESRPNHGLFIGYAKNGGQEDIAFATRIAFGYSSTNAAVVAKDLLNYYYNLQEETEILTGEAMQNGLSTTHFD